jgi:hypothetical protein
MFATRAMGCAIKLFHVSQMLLPVAALLLLIVFSSSLSSLKYIIYIVLCIMSLQKEYQPVEMEEGIIAVAEAVPTPTAASMTAAAVPMIQVVAPATLPEGYTFEADIGGRVIVVTVVSKSE